MSPAVDYERLARYYDALITTQDDVGFFLDECLEAGGKAVELMAGTGRVSVPLLEAGVDLTCVDSSSTMLSVLRQKLDEKGLDSPLFEQDIRQLALPDRFTIAFVAFHSFEELCSPDDRRIALEAVLRALEPGGRFLCTLHNAALREELLADRRRQDFVRAAAPDGDGEIGLSLDLDWDPNLNLVSGVETLTRYSPDGTSRVLERLPLRFALVPEEEFRTSAIGAGFRVVTIFGGWEHQPFDADDCASMVWVLERPA